MDRKVPYKKYLYHGTYTIGAKRSILENGLFSDHVGMIYLSEKPIRGCKYYFRVQIPDQAYLTDWRDFWYDDNDEEIDMDHQYDPDNPYYVYLGNIPAKYIELLD